MTNKEFVPAVIEQLIANPRKVLAGHGISGAMLNKIKNREDIFKNLARILNKLKTFKRGAIGLKKSSVFQIKVYRNFAELNTKARADVDTFIAGLKPEDADTFNNANNIVCVVFDPKDSGLEGEEVRAAAGYSEMIKFDTAVRKEFKMPGVAYMVVMYADSAIRTVEVKIAERKASRNERENKREEKPAKVKKALADKKKLAAKIKKIKAEYGEKIAENTAELQKLRAQQQRLQFQNQQIAKVGTENALDRKFRATRVEKLKAKLEAATLAAEEYIKQLETATGKKRLSVQSMLSKKNREIRKLRAAIGTYNRLGPAAIAKKGEMLHLVQNKIKENLANGEALSTAMNNALDALNARPAQKTIIKQQVINQVAEGMPMQYAVQQAVQNTITSDGSMTDEEIDVIADKVIRENNGKAPIARMLPYQISRLGNVNITKSDMARVSNAINNKLLDIDEINDVVDVAEEADETAEIVTSTDAQELMDAIDTVTKRKRRTKAEIIKARKLEEKAKRAKLRAKREREMAAKMAKRAKIAAKKEKIRVAAELKAQRMAAKKAKKLGTTPVELDPVVQQIIDETPVVNNQINDFNSLMAAIEETPAVQNQVVVDNIDPVVQQILDDTEDDFVNPDNEVVPDLNDSLTGTTDFAELLNLL